MSIPQLQKALVIPEHSAAFDLKNFAGEVVEVGKDTQSFSVGDRVFGEGDFRSNRVAGFQQFTILPAAFAAKIPSGMSFDDASTLPLALATSFVALYNEPPHGVGFDMSTQAQGCGKYTTTPILIIGGATSVGQAAIRLAKLSGFSPIITTASLKNETALIHLGADHVVDRTKSEKEIATEIRPFAGNGKRLKNVFDCVSSPGTQHMALDLVESQGKVATVLEPVKDLNPGDKTVFQTFGLPSVRQNASLCGKLFRDSAEDMLENGFIQPNRVEVLQGGLRGIVSGLERLEKGDISRLKLVVHPQETAE